MTARLTPLLLLLLFTAIGGRAQVPGRQMNDKTDSLKQELCKAKSDTARLRWRYEIARIQKVSRPGFWDSLAADARRCHSLRFEGKSLVTKGQSYYWNNGKADKAFDCFNAGYQLLLKAGIKTDLFAPLFGLISHFYNNGDMVTSLKYCFEGVKIAEEVNDKKTTTTFLSHAANCYLFTGNIQKANDMQLKCLAISREINDPQGIAEALMELGAIQVTLRQRAMAGDYYLKCKPFLPLFKDNDFLSAELCNCIGSGYQMFLQFDSAYKYAYKAYELTLKIGREPYIMGTLVTLAGVCYDGGDNTKAQLYAEKAMHMLEHSKYKQQNLELDDILRRIYVKKSDYKNAYLASMRYIEAKDSLYSANNRKKALEKEFDYELDKKESAKKLLEQENDLQKMALNQDKYLLGGMGILLILILLIAWLFFRQNKFKNEQQSMLLEQKLLRSQMNPHFIFNSLQAVQNFILKEDKQRAASYLGSFAGIMRNVLENSRLEAITLKKEIALLENYLQLQKLRFGQRFDYDIKVDELIDPETIYIPPMLAQPFIENAVEHGFHGIESGGLITITYTLQNDVLNMEISDNGVGMKDNYSSNKKHQSLAIDITRERMTLINKHAKGKAFFRVGEAFPLNAGRKGVKVNFSIPINLEA